jgi:hypothetical protein
VALLGIKRLERAMSYDLFLFRAPSQEPLSAKECADYFRGRAHFREDGFYENEDTGVYFSFNHSEPEDGESDEDAPDIANCHMWLSI